MKGIIHPNLTATPFIVSIPTGQWSGANEDYYINVTASNVTADSILVPTCDRTSEGLLKGSVWCVPAAGSFTIHTNVIPAGTVTIMVQFVGVMGEANYQVLADVYSKSQTYSKTEAVAKADIINNLTSTATDQPLSAAQGKALSTAIQQSTAFVPSTGNAGFHNSIYRGKSLGTSVTSAQWAAISAGTFDDLFIGDFWVINSVTWRIAAFDYWLNHGDTACKVHHVVIVPDSIFASCKMNDTDITTGAYIGSDYYTGANGNTGKATAQSAINGAFGSGHILTHREYLKNTTQNGHESSGAWYDSTFELMTEQMVYGCKVFGNVMCGTNVPASYTIGTSQLPLFRHDHGRICNRATWWLRDVASATNFALADRFGYCSCTVASASLGVRPAFGIRA